MSSAAPVSSAGVPFTRYSPDSDVPEYGLVGTGDWQVAGMVNLGEPTMRVVYDASVPGARNLAMSVVNTDAAEYSYLPQPGVRDGLAPKLKAQGIPTAIYYPKPLHRLEAYKRFPVADNGIPTTDQLAEEVISLPMHAYLDVTTQDRVIEAVRAALRP